MIRDPKTKAILNDDVVALNKYKKERQQTKKLETLSRELEEVKITLAKVLERIEKV